MKRRQQTISKFLEKKPTTDDSNITPSSSASLVSVIELPLQGTSILQLQSSGDLDLSKSKYEQPMQPKLNAYPRNDSKLCFSHSFYLKYDWLEYSVSKDCVYCYFCRHFAPFSARRGETLGDRLLIERGFSKWNYISQLLKKHQQSERHVNAFEDWAHFKKCIEGSSVPLENILSKIAQNREHVKELFRITRFLGKQGLAFRVHDESANGNNRGNFVELLSTFAEIDKNFKENLERHYVDYTSHEYQNELISVYGNKILQHITQELVGKFFAILVDETKDLAKKQQIALLLRYYDNGQVKERAVGLYQASEWDAESLSAFILKIIRNLGLDIQNCIGQCYDGASVMNGRHAGAQARIKEVVPHALYVHGHAHCLNLALIQTIKNIPTLSDFFDTVQILYEFISNSNTHHTLFIKAQKSLNQQVLEFERNTPTICLHWYKSIKTIILRYDAIQAVLLAIMNIRTESSQDAKNINSQIESPSFLLNLFILEALLGATNSLSEQLHEQNSNVLRASTLIESTRAVLEKMRSEIFFNQLYEKFVTFAKNNNIKTNTFNASVGVGLGRPFRVIKASATLKKFLVESTIGKEPAAENIDKKTAHRQFYYEVLDLFSMEFNARFTTNLWSSLEAFDVCSPKFLGLIQIEEIANLYRVHINAICLESQINVAKEFLLNSKAECPLEMLRMLESLPTAYSELIKIFKIVLTLPITTPSKEHFFSVLKRIKTFLSTIKDDNLSSYLMLMASETELIDSIKLEECVNDFAKLRKRRYPLL